MFAGGASASCNCVIANGKIAFVSSRDSKGPVAQTEIFQIYVMNPDGSGQTRLTNNSLDDQLPAWSPSGTKIAFQRSVPGGQQKIYVMNADGSGQTQLTFFNTGDAIGPAWSPSGTKIAFTYIGVGDAEIYVMNADGSDPTNITNDPRWDFGPSWSPDGKIAFTRLGPSIADTGIAVMNADGSGQTQLTSNCNDRNPAWSPDGTKIVLEGALPMSCNYTEEIVVMNADGSGRTLLTNDSEFDTEPTWSPNGKKIALTVQHPNSDPEIYVMNADGSGRIQLTTTLVNWQPTWQNIFVAKASSHLIPHTGVPDSIFKWKAGGFAAREPVTMFFDGARIGATNANPGGRLNVELTVPDSARPGEHTLEAIGRWSDVTVRDVFVVLSSATRR
jgi:Tol biopolymer transport system component